MRFPQLHKFLVWAGPALLAGFAAGATAFATLAQAYPKVKKWGEDWFVWAEPVVTAPWFFAAFAVLILGYVAALVWTGGQSPAHEIQQAYQIELARQNAKRDAQRKRTMDRVSGEIAASLHVAARAGNREHSLFEATKPVSPLWVPIHKALKFLVYDTQWAEVQSAPKDAREFDQVVGSEFLERLARGEIKARGRRGWESTAQKQRTTEDIPADYWTNAFLQAHGAIVLADPMNGDAVGNLGKDRFLSVIVDYNDIENVWDRRKQSSEHTALAQFCEPLRSKIERERQNEQARHQPPV